MCSIQDLALKKRNNPTPPWDHRFKHHQKRRVGGGRLGGGTCVPTFVKFEPEETTKRSQQGSPPPPQGDSQQRNKLEMSDPLYRLFIQLERKPSSTEPRRQDGKLPYPWHHLMSLFFKPEKDTKSTWVNSKNLASLRSSRACRTCLCYHFPSHLA